MAIKCEQYNQVCVVAMDSDLSGDSSLALKKAVEEQIEARQVVDFAIDCEKCGFIDSEGLESLLWIKRRCEDLFGQLKLINLDENCRKILEITRLDPRFECHPDLEAALKTMR